MILAALLGLAAAAELGHARLDHAQVEVAWVAPFDLPVGDVGDFVVVNRIPGLLVLGRAPLGPVIFDLVRGALAALAGWGDRARRAGLRR